MTLIARWIVTIEISSGDSPTFEDLDAAEEDIIEVVHRLQERFPDCKVDYHAE